METYLKRILPPWLLVLYAGARRRPRLSRWLQALPGAIAGLFLARVALEAARRPWPGVLVVAIALLAGLVGFALAYEFLVVHCSLIHWSLVILLVYVLWPRRDFVAAGSVAVLVALIWLLSRERSYLPRRAALWADGATFVVALAAYIATLSPDVLPADSGEFQRAAALLGVLHPPGYPLYTVLGHLFVRLVPLGTPAYRLNLLSAVLAAGTLVLLARAVRLWAGRLGASARIALAGGLVTALTLGTAATFWAQATIANIRTPTAFCAALAFYALARFATAAEPKARDRALVLLGLALGLGLGHHPSLGFIAIFFGIYVLLIDPRLALQPRRWWKPALAALAGLLPFAYLPLRATFGPPVDPSNLNTLEGFLWHVTAKGFEGDMFAFANTVMLPHRLALVPTLFAFQFNFVLLAAALFGLLGLLRRDWRLFVLLMGGLLLHTFVTVTYRAPQTVEYLMPAYLPIAIAVGLLPVLGSRGAEERRRGGAEAQQDSSAPLLLCSLALWAGLLNGYAHAPSFVELARDTSTRQTVQPLLETAPRGALILADWHWATPMWYLQQVEGLRPDVTVRYVWPIEGDDWLPRVQEADPGQAILLTSFHEFPGYTTEPWEAGFWLHPRPATEPAAPLTPVARTFGEKVEIVGYSLRQGTFYPGQMAEFVLAWRATDTLDVQPSLTLRFVDAGGNQRAQADQALNADTAPGEVRFERLVLPLYPTLSPGSYQVTLGVYTVTDMGFETLRADDETDTVTLTNVELTPAGCNPQSATLRPCSGQVCNLQSAPFTLHRLAVPFSGGPTLVGVDYDRSVPDTLRVYLRWQGPADRVQARIQAGGLEALATLPPVPARAFQTVALDLPGYAGGSLRLTLTGGDGQMKNAAGSWGWTVQRIRLPAPAPGARFVPLGDEMAVVGAAAHPAAPGETMTVNVTLVSLRPLTSDDATSVRLMDAADGRWLASHDGQPGLGAFPTLKWIRGSRVVDRHLLPVPADFTGQATQATLVAYDRFRMTRLVPMDGRFSDVPLGSWPQ